MPLANVEISGINGRLAVWMLEESSDDLLTLVSLNDEIFSDFDTSQTEKRKKEWLAARLLVRELLGKDVRICYTDRGRPYLENSALNISVSHSGCYVVVAVSTGWVGVDIQTFGRHALVKGSDFFLNKREMALLPGISDKRTLYLYWAIKEAVYKYAVRDINMKEDISIYSSTDGASCFCDLNCGGIREHVDVSFWFRDHYVLAVASESKSWR